MGLKETLAGMAQSHAAKEMETQELPIRIENWGNQVQRLYGMVKELVTAIDPLGEIIFRQKDFQANTPNPYGNYKSKSFEMQIYGKTIELKPFSSLHDEEVNTVHMSKVGRAERIRFLYVDNQWKIAVQPANEHEDYMAGRKPVWTYEAFTPDSFNAALDYLLNRGRAA